MLCRLVNNDRRFAFIFIVIQSRELPTFSRSVVPSSASLDCLTLEDGSTRFNRNAGNYLLGRPRPESVVTTSLRNVGNYLPVHITSHKTSCFSGHDDVYKFAYSNSRITNLLFWSVPTHEIFETGVWNYEITYFSLDAGTLNANQMNNFTFWQRQR